MAGLQFFLGGAFGNGLTDSDGNMSETVVLGRHWAADVNTTASMVLLYYIFVLLLEENSSKARS